MTCPRPGCPYQSDVNDIVLEEIMPCDLCDRCQVMADYTCRLLDDKASRLVVKYFCRGQQAKVLKVLDEEISRLDDEFVQNSPHRRLRGMYVKLFRDDEEYNDDY